MSPATALKPDSPERETSRPYSRNAIPRKTMMPLMRCRMDAMAGIGKWMVLSSRLTGLLVFTALSRSSEVLRYVVTLTETPGGLFVLDRADTDAVTANRSRRRLAREGKFRLRWRAPVSGLRIIDIAPCNYKRFRVARALYLSRIDNTGTHGYFPLQLELQATIYTVTHPPVL